ncbi:MAG: TetR family transcriptional regulator [Nocardioidaceae bacterium]
MTGVRRPGRPRREQDRPDTRDAILAAARDEFAAKGFDAASMRAVARAADVDPALVYHYFGSKEGLMLAALSLPIDPREVVPRMLADGFEGLPERIADLFLSLWESEGTRTPLVAMVRSAATSENAADLLRSGWARMIVEPVAAALSTPDARLRAEMVASQLLGLAMARYVIRIEPLASAAPSDVVPRLAGTIRTALAGLDPAAEAER